jgi:hypothetical protein
MSENASAENCRDRKGFIGTPLGLMSEKIVAQASLE